jgi:hypothetical protein
VHKYVHVRRCRFFIIKNQLNGCGQILLEPYEYLLQVPGKDVRGKLIDSFNKWLQISEPELNQIKTIVSMLHNSSLLYPHSFLLSAILLFLLLVRGVHHSSRPQRHQCRIDDIEDNSVLRRGLPGRCSMRDLLLGLCMCGLVLIATLRCGPQWPTRFTASRRPSTAPTTSTSLRSSNAPP